MVMIRCPECGHRVLDVATACPQCHRVLLQNPLETHNWGSLRECGRCHKHIERDAVLCPYCGHHVRAARVAGRVTIGVILAGLVAAGAVAAWRTGLVGTVRDAFVRGPRPPAAAPLATPTADTTSIQDTVPEVTVPPVVAVAPESTSAPGVDLPAPTPTTTRTAPDTPAGLVRRWTADWANVRAGRSIESAVVRVLAPNVEVHVVDMRSGWWAMYVGDALVGYIANSLLRTTPASR